MTTIEAIKACVACAGQISRDAVTVDVKGEHGWWYVTVTEECHPNRHYSTESVVGVLSSTYPQIADSQEAALLMCLEEQKNRLRTIVREAEKTVAYFARRGIQSQAVLGEVER